MLAIADERGSKKVQTKRAESLNWPNPEARRHFALANCYLLIANCLFLTSCGVPGAPLPPSLGIPKPVSDLKATRKGDVVTLTWSAPEETSDGELIRSPGKMVVSRILEARKGEAREGAGTTPVVVAVVPLVPTLKDQQPPTANDSLAAVLPAPAGDFVTYGVSAQSNSGKSAGTSNPATIPLVPTPAPPARVQAVAVPEGISLTWEQAWPPQNQTRLSTQYVYRIMRREQGTTASWMITQLNAGNQAMAFIDTGIEWQKHYDYWITPVTLWESAGKKGEVEGENSPVTSVFANDVFPPAAPAGLQAVASGLAEQKFIDLTWTPNTEPDLAGYNVYRHAGSEAPVRINSNLVKTPSFRDMNAQPGVKYFYSVSAIDLRNNESGKSEETSETVPQ